ncbi:hypothetical protein JI752_009460 [Lysobacter sp. MMG2]|nr:hypothetical protein [Lysobacter sp. MMG2]
MQDEVSGVRPDTRCAVAGMAFAAAVSTAFAAQSSRYERYVQSGTGNAACVPKQAAPQRVKASGVAAGTAED